MIQRIGTCGNCGGDVMGEIGPWLGVIPPPPPRCNGCGATPKGYDDVLPMNPPPSHPSRPETVTVYRKTTTTTKST